MPPLHTFMTNDCFLDRNEVIEVNDKGLLPHWNQSGKIQYITFRLVDSLPQSRLSELKQLKEKFLKNNPLPWDYDTLQKYWKTVSPFESELLDAGYGQCILKNADIRRIVSDSLSHFNGMRYDLLAYVIMPNHVHILLLIYDGEQIENIMHSLKSFTSKMINRKTGQSGSVWMREYFDRIVRTKQHLRHCIDYIKENPRFLPEEEYTLYINNNFI